MVAKISILSSRLKLALALAAAALSIARSQAQETDITITRPALKNISARAFVRTGDSVGIGGFIISGSLLRDVIVRGLGPSLSVGNTPLAGRLPNPTLELYDGSGTIVAANDNWRSTQQQTIQDSGFAPANDLESALRITLAPGAYTAVLRGANGGTGLGLIEIYDVGSGFSSELVNLSARGFIGTGDNVLIAGLIIQGQGAVRVLVRALGPSLSAGGVPTVLQNPTLTLYDENGTVFETNDNWGDSSEKAEIQNMGLAPTDSREAAIVAILPPGFYTAVVRGVNSTTGNALTEVYRLSDLSLPLPEPSR